ncbi:hypothetical protein [Caldovatus aquaticus]|uniref:Uncharacterized protein n=1 Tax=Caldovatus aquaticus TaxID=2865671 RepID=A0ABS7F3Z9_9PROT|nr:hypothetical protein [Caldovatus aquaticus]MBW8270263.1 hypothetical protein [Caldovatus aquaticus]
MSAIGTALRWSTGLAATGAAGAAAVPVAANPDLFVACLPPAAPALSLSCLGAVGLDLAAMLGVIAGILAALGALARSVQERIEDRLLAAEVRAAVARSLGGSERHEP